MIFNFDIIKKSHFKNFSRPTSFGNAGLGYGLDISGIVVRFLRRQNYFSFLHLVQTRFETKPTPCPVGTGGSFWGLSGQDLNLTIHVQLIPAINMRGCIPPLSYISSRRTA
jgi:hypothetical protein